MSEFNFCGHLTSGLIKTIILELQKKTNRDKIIKHLINPVINDITSRYYSYFLSLILILIFMVLMLIILIILIIFHK